MGIEPDEEAGLRAFALQVEAYAGAQYPERPTAVVRAGARVAVAEVLAAWREQERIGFRVLLENGERGLLYYVPELDLWSGVVGDAPDLARTLRRRHADPAGDGAGTS
ncbi:MAG TPA: hypothetical protein VNM91_01830 [Dehalococcoidia bacterium]|nr:hypothetical protein [Dehalococcoidia bacterium]